MKRKQVQVNDWSGGQYSVNNSKRLKLKSYLFDYSDAYTFVERRISVEGNALNDGANKKLVFKNNAVFKSCISKINSKFIDKVEYWNVNV